ncbi:hypothetical protein D3C72_1686590 [compost metagenome]
MRPGEGPGHSLRKAARGFQRFPAAADLRTGWLQTLILKKRERGEPAGGFRTICTENTHAIACQIDIRHGTASHIVHIRKPLPDQRIKGEAATGKVGKLAFRPQMIAHADGIAGEACFLTGRIPIANAGHATLSVADNLYRHDAPFDPHAARKQRRDKPHALEELHWSCHHPRQALDLREE